MTRTEKFHLTTTGVIILTIVALVAYDIFTVSYAGVDSSISRIILLFLRDHPAVACAAGALVGHLTWSTDVPPNRRDEIVLLVGGLVLMVAVDLFAHLPPAMPLWPFLLGIPAGHTLWGQCVSPAQRLVRAMKRRA